MNLLDAADPSLEPGPSRARYLSLDMLLLTTTARERSSRRQSFTEFKPVHASEVKRLLKNLIPNKAPGPDDISPLELKLASGKIAATVAALFNESLSSGTLPEQFKMANLHPLLKPGKTDTSLPANYRGISLTCIISKLLEKIVCNQVSAFMTKNGVFSEYQYGFRKARSCSDLLVATIDDWHLAQDANKFTAIAFIDLSKAFDNVCHATLLLMLQKFGLCGTVLQWFFNYLFNRQQRIHLQVPFTTSKGVPQGSVLGPLLFNIYVSDLADLATAHRARLPSFADDFTLYASSESPTAACDHVSSVLRRLKSCLDDRGLEINSGKTVAMLISPSRSRMPTIDFRINLNGAEMKFVKQTRLLGIIIDDSLSWSYHIDSFCCKVGRKIGALRRSFRLLTPHARRTFFYISDSAWLGICRSGFYTKHERRSEKSPSGCLAESNPLRSRCWISRRSNPSPQWVPAYQHCWSMDRTICLLCSPMCETRSSVYVMCETPTASSPPLHQRTGEFLPSVPGEQSCWSCILFDPCSTYLELFTCWRSRSTITVFF